VTGLLVALGAAVGAPLRFLLGHHLDTRLPWGTWVANVGGSFVLGLCAGLALGGDAWALLGVGFCGGLTTYSSFTVQTHERGPRLGAAYVVLTLVAALLAVTVGFVLGA
jgi:CrcB protein